MRRICHAHAVTVGLAEAKTAEVPCMRNCHFYCWHCNTCKKWILAPKIGIFFAGARRGVRRCRGATCAIFGVRGARVALGESAPCPRRRHRQRAGGEQRSPKFHMHHQVFCLHSHVFFCGMLLQEPRSAQKCHISHMPRMCSVYHQQKFWHLAAQSVLQGLRGDRGIIYFVCGLRVLVVFRGAR